MIDLLLLPFQLDFMRNALIVAVIVAVPMALLSCFVVLKGWSLIGDAISHAVFPGVILSYIAGLPYVVGAFAAGMVCALSTGFLKDNSRIKQDTAMGVVFAGMFALGLVLHTRVRATVHLDHILFGDMLGIVPADFATAAIVAAVTVIAILAKWRDFLLHAFDPAQAAAVGLPVRRLHYGLLALISLAIVGALQAVGIILAVAMLIAPGAISFLLVRRFSAMLVFATLTAAACALGGVYLSFFLDSAPAPTIVLLLGACFVAALVVSRLRDRRAGDLEPSRTG